MLYLGHGELLGEYLPEKVWIILHVNFSRPLAQEGSSKTPAVFQ